MAKLIGTDPNQVPTNADLGTMAYQDAERPVLGQTNVKSAGTALIVERTGNAPNLQLKGNGQNLGHIYAFQNGLGGDLAFYPSNSSGSITQRMKIHSDGYVTMPYQPAFHVGLSINTSSLLSGATVIFNSVYENRGNHYNTSTGVFTAPVAGFYSFTTRMLHQGVSNGHAVDSQMQKNGSSSIGNNFLMQRHKYQNDYTGHTGYLSEGTSGMIYLAANDNFRVKYGGSQNSVIHGNPAWTYFCGHLVG